MAPRPAKPRRCSACRGYHPGTVCRTKQRLDTARRRARYGTTTQRGYGAEYQRNRLACLQRDRHLCQLRLAGCTIKATTADHITPTTHGGTHALTNLRAACAHCNSSRGNRATPTTPRRRAW